MHDSVDEIIRPGKKVRREEEVKGLGPMLRNYDQEEFQIIIFSFYCKEIFLYVGIIYFHRTRNFMQYCKDGNETNEEERNFSIFIAAHSNVTLLLMSYSNSMSHHYRKNISRVHVQLNKSIICYLKSCWRFYTQNGKKTRLTLARKNVFSSRDINQIRKGGKCWIIVLRCHILRSMKKISKCIKKIFLPLAATLELAVSHPILIYRREIEDICMYRVRVRECDTTPNPLVVPPVAVHHHQIALCYSFLDDFLFEIIHFIKCSLLYNSINHLVWALEMP